MIITKKKKITAKDTEGWLKSTQKAKEIKKLWSDGYDVGDISKTILKTGNVAVNSAADAMVNIGKGTFTAAEGIVDAARYKIGDVFKKSANWQADMWEKAGYKDYAKGLRKSGQQIYDYEKSNATMNVTGALLGETNDIFKKNWSKKVDENSILDSKADSVMQGVGQVGFNIGAGYLTGGSSLSTFGATFASAYGNARSEAYNNGADDKTAKTTGLISGLSEAISEQVFSGIPGLKTAGWGDKVIGKIGKSVENYFGSSTGKMAIKALDAIGEGSEEIISNVLTSIGNNIAHNINEKYTYGMENQSGNILEDIKAELTSQESWDAFISAMLTSAITNGGVDIVNNKRNNSAIKSYAKENNITTEQAKQLFNEVARKNASQEVTSNYKEQVELEEQVKNRLATNIKEDIKTGINKINLEEMRNAFLSKENFMKSVGTKYKENNKEIYKTSSEGLNLIDSYRAYNGNENKISEINNIQKYMEGRNIDSRFDATMFESEKQNALWQTKDGKSTVIFNPNATQEQIIEEIATHEMTHDIINQKTETGTSLFSDVLEYAKSTENYENMRKDLEKSYSKYYDTTSKDFSQKIDEEIVANTLGKQLGTQEYINRIVNNNPNIAQKIYRWVVDKLQTSNTIKDNNNNVTGFKSERLYWEGVKNRFEKAYNEAKIDNNSTSDIKYSTISAEGAKNLSKSFYEFQDTYKNYIEAQKLYEKLSNENHSFNYINTELKNQTQWFRTKYGDWATLISDKGAKITKKLEPNTEYKLGDIFSHPLLYKAYPGIENMDVITTDIDGAYGSLGHRVQKENTESKKVKNNFIKLNNKYINERNYIGTLIHEVNHYIQLAEGFDKKSTGSSSKRVKNIDDYYNNLGEIMSNEANINRNLTQKQLNDIILPEQAKENPKYDEIEKTLLDREENDWNPTSPYFAKNISKNKEQQLERVHRQFDGIRGITDSLYDEELVNSSFSLEQRVTGDELLDAQDLIEEIKSVGANVDKNGYVTLYHQTTNENADKIKQSGKMIAKEPYVYFSTSKGASQSDGRGNTKLEFKIPAEKLILDDIFDDNADVKVKLDNSKELDISSYLVNDEIGIDSLKEKQLEIIKNNNPVNDDYHTWIRNIEDIKTLEEAINDSDWKDYDEYNPDLSRQDIETAIKNGKITVYSSYPIKPEIFISPSKMEAESYSSNGKVYSKEVNINDVAWIDPTQGQYANIEVNADSRNSLVNKNNDLIPLKGTKTKMSELFNKDLAPIREDIKAVSKQINNLSKQIETLQNQTPNSHMDNDIIPVRKVLNPAEIANLRVEDANTTPNLPNKSYEKGTKKSKFYKNITEKTQMLPETARTLLSDENNIQYYKGITNEESMNEALKRLQKDGTSETNRWFNQKSESATANDVAEGWILLKQYSDNKNYDNMIQVAKKMRDIGSAAGQTVQAFNIMSRLTPEGMVKYAQSELTEAYNQMVKNKSQDWINKNMKNFDLTPGDVEFIMNTMEKVQTMQDGYEKRVELAKIQKLMTDKIPSNAGNKIKAWMRISMLFNPKTQVRNVVGNAIMLPVNYFSDIVSNYADKAIQKQTGVRTTGTYNIKALLKGMKEGAYQATNDYKLGINTKNMDGNRFEIGEGKSFNEKSAIGRALNRTESMLNYVMDAGDRVFSQAVFENSLANQQTLNKTTEITQEMIDIATTESLQRTWNDNNNYTKFVLDIRSKLNSLPSIKGYGLGDILIPFAKTPANLTKAIVDYSPVGLVSTINQYVKLKNNISTGTVTSQQQHQFVQSLGKATAGSMLYIIAYALAKAGIANGASDDDKDTANFLKNTLGISSYSIKIGGKSFTYDWAQPLAAPLSIMTNITDKSKETTLYEAIIGNLDSATSVLMEQSFLESINDVLNGNGGTVDNLMQQVYELPSRAVPTFVKQMADMVDGTQRQTYVKDAPLRTATNKTISKIPFLSKTLDASVDTMGRDIEKYGGKNNIFNVFLNPATVNTENISSAAKEIYNVYKETGNNSVMPKVAPYYINSNNEKIILSTEERTKYQRVAGNIVEENVDNLIKNGVYNSLSNKDKANIINDIVNYSYNIARKEALGMDLPSTYNSAYKYSEIGDISDYFLYKNTTADEDSQEKKKKIAKYLTNSNLSNNQIAYLYGLDYSNETILNSLVNANIPIKEFIKLNSTTITSDYDKNGNTIVNSRKKKYISYVNSLNLTIPQKAMLIKMEYSSYKNYDKQIVSYVNKQNLTKFEKASILKKTNFDNYDDYIVDYILNTGKTSEEMEKTLKNLGFKIRNGKIYG